MSMSINSFYNLIKDKITLPSNAKEDSFVGISYQGDKLRISPPLGFAFTELKVNDINSKISFRNDLKLLIYTIKKYYLLRDSDDANSDELNSIESQGVNKTEENLPIFSYDYIVKDFISNGYYYEREVINKKLSNGKINWKKTIQNEKPYCNNGSFVYLNFIRKKNNILTNELITQLHKTCVYESFDKWGFMYVDNNIAEKPKIKISEARKYIPFLRQKLSKTFNDRNKKLFEHMIKVIEQKVSFSDKKIYKYGVSHFYPVWEKMVDKVYGIDEISKYYPSGKWYFVNDGDKKSSNLREDTIMECNGDVFVLDSKYYTINKYPSTADINKQITYGKTVETVLQEENKCKVTKKEKDIKEPYNAFILPNIVSNEKGVFYFGYATIESLKDYKDKKYGKVAGIYLDVRKLMNYKYRRADNTNLSDLAEIIKSNIDNVLEESKKKNSKNA